MVERNLGALDSPTGRWESALMRRDESPRRRGPSDGEIAENHEDLWARVDQTDNSVLLHPVLPVRGKRGRSSLGSAPFAAHRDEPGRWRRRVQRPAGVLRVSSGFSGHCDRESDGAGKLQFVTTALRQLVAAPNKGSLGEDKCSRQGAGGETSGSDKQGCPAPEKAHGAAGSGSSSRFLTSIICCAAPTLAFPVARLNRSTASSTSMVLATSAGR